MAEESLLKKQMMQQLLRDHLTQMQKGEKKGQSCFFIDHDTIHLLILGWLMKDNPSEMKSEEVIAEKVLSQIDDMTKESREAFEALKKDLEAL